MWCNNTKRVPIYSANFLMQVECFLAPLFSPKPFYDSSAHPGFIILDFFIWIGSFTISLRPRIRARTCGCGSKLMLFPRSARSRAQYSLYFICPSVLAQLCGPEWLQSKIGHCCDNTNNDDVRLLHALLFR